VIPELIASGCCFVAAAAGSAWLGLDYRRWLAKRSPSVRAAVDGRMLFAAWAEGLAQGTRSPRDDREGLDPAGPVNAELLSVCPICGMSDLATGLGVRVGEWRGWPAHADCVEWLAIGALDRPAIDPVTGHPHDAAAVLRGGMRTLNEHRTTLGDSYAHAFRDMTIGGSARFDRWSPADFRLSAGQTEDIIAAETGTRPLTGARKTRVTSEASAALRCNARRGDKVLLLNQRLAANRVVIQSGGWYETVGVEDCVGILGSSAAKLVLAEPLVFDYPVDSVVVVADHAVRPSSFIGDDELDRRSARIEASHGDRAG
jgi:hypothetical protein